MKTGAKAPRSIQSSISTIRQYADSFIGLTVPEAKRRCSRAKIRMTRWEQGKQLVATFPKYEMRLMLFGNKVLVASFQIISPE